MTDYQNTSSGNHGGNHVQASYVDRLVMNVMNEAAQPKRPLWDVSRALHGPFVNHDDACAYAGKVYRETALEGRPGSLYVIGPRGVGKSAFGVEAAYLLRSLYRESASEQGDEEGGAARSDERGVWGLHVDLDEQRAAGAEAGNHAFLGDALASLLRDLGMPGDEVPPTLRERSREFRRITGEESCIVIVEGIASAREADLFATGDGSMVLLTGRGEIAGLRRRNVPTVRLPALRSDDALALLRGFDGPGERLARLIDAEPEAARALADRCGGLPLALQIVGAYLSMRPEETPASVVARLDAAGTRLPEELDRLVEAEEGEPRLDEVIALGFGDLRSDAAQRLYRALGDLPGRRVHEGLPAALLGSLEEARDALGRLVRSCLMAAEGGGRYRWEPLIRHDAYRRAQAEPDERRRDARERAVGWYTSALAKADRSMGMGGGRSRATAAHGDAAAAREITAPFGDAEGEALAWVGEVLDAVPALMALAVESGRRRDALVMAESCWYGVHELRRGSVGTEIFRHGGEIARAEADPVAAARMDNYLARALVDDGELDEAAQVLATALDEAPREWERAVLLETRGLLHKDRGEFDAAEADLQERRRINEELGELRALAIDGYQIGGLHLSAGDLAAARSELEAVRAMAEERQATDGDWRSLAAKTEARLAQAYLRSGDPEAALAAGTAALQAFGEAAPSLRKADALAVMARAQGRMGDTGDPGGLGDANAARTWAATAARLYRRHHLYEKAEGLADLLG
ncbi:tetratricopeptide repeat protein [Nocardiopsis suaedae]|uniref:NB-ARC domain-containing protein n=1 Tax=Nocardiopsis suaedae TaxID=3018444 RepID=A0ABT4TTX4_9ACTN|nr:NB-ARC domain-containing protein [Nocardiopsis suaedae]MDA2808151.1 NB-ARC domain-containing protein [Nocardiopsis suaedae]